MKLASVSLLALGLASALPAQTPSTPPAGAPLRPVVPSTPGQPASPTYELALKWDERNTAVLTVPLKNTSERPLKILGVQATGGLFVGDFPTTVAPGKEDSITFVYQAPGDTDGDTDLIRVLTDQGVRQIIVKLARAAAAQLASREVRWTVGDTPAAKSITLTVAAGTVAPRRLRVSGGHQAVLEKTGDTTWQVKVTPASTAKSGQFAVFVDFDQPLPGQAVVILGVIQPKD